MMVFKEISADQFQESPFHLIGKEWMLVTAETGGKRNVMTASWGGLGVMWNKNAAFVVIRPQRYTKEFFDAADTFSLTFFDECFREKMAYIGTTSGRKEDKIVRAGLTVRHDGPTPYYEEADAALICRKMYAQPMSENAFIDRAAAEQWYPDKDFHTLYIAEVMKILVKA